MRKSILFSLLWIAAVVFSCGSKTKGSGPRMVLIRTGLGDIKVKLYDETPQHRDNFIKLVSEGYFNDLLFHRVIKNFMIQGGDPASKGAAPGVRLGGGGPGYTIPAEFNPELVHKKGALSAARTGDQVNPEKRSSGSQFYIVQGKIYRNGELDTLEMNMNNQLYQKIFQQNLAAAQNELNKYREDGNQAAFEKKASEIKLKTDSAFQVTPKLKFTDKQREAYTTQGGAPHLDAGYTVFGEVVEGVEVIDKIAGVETDQNDRPVTDVKMKIEIIN